LDSTFKNRTLQQNQAALEAEAALNGRSLSEEIEARLEQSLLVQHLLTGPEEIRDANRTATVQEAGAATVREYAWQPAPALER